MSTLKLICLALPVLFAGLPSPGAAETCGGTNMLASMASDRLDAITERVDAVPYAHGNAWRATRGGDLVHLVGTYHFDDARHDTVMKGLSPLIDDAAIVLLEAGPDEQKQLQAEMLSRPDRLFVTDGPTLPERLEEADWQALSTAMEARGIPGFFASKMQPWYVAMMLGVPPCAMEELTSGARGLDLRIEERASAAGIPVRALEPYDTALRIFDKLDPEAQLEMIRSTLAIGDRAEDYSATLAALYFDESSRTIWELSRYQTYDLPGKTPDIVDAEFAEMEDVLMVGRNRSWIPVILEALDEGPVLAAFGALHLSGEDGVLALLDREGFTIERIAFGS